MDDEDHDELWQFATKDVEKIAREEGLEPAPERPRKAPAKRVKAKGSQEPVLSADASPLSSKAQSSRNKDLDRRTAERLRKGQIPIEATLDLHGLRRAQAHDVLKAFILGAVAQQKRMVLVITGKGGGPDGRIDPLVRGQGVLRQVVPQWLHDAPLADVVLKSVPAQPKDGGSGALYVYLRRAR